MRESLREERTLWVTDQIAQDNFPENLEGFYLLKDPPAEEKPPPDEGGGGAKGKVCVLALRSHSVNSVRFSVRFSLGYLRGCSIFVHDARRYRRSLWKPMLWDVEVHRQYINYQFITESRMDLKMCC